MTEKCVMCGIAGYIKFNQKSESPDLKAMLDVVKYRGPDDEGIYKRERVGLGHRRLSILDLSSAGHQPMFYQDQNLIIIYNGEVYNYLELRGELKNKGYKFNTGTDTQVILAAYQEWAEDCVKRFNGMWALAIWDKANKKLFLSRDRFGIKPLFYYQDKDLLIFASEIKSILTYPKYKKEIHHQYLYNFIDRQTQHGDDQTVFKKIKQLLPGSNLIIQPSPEGDICKCRLQEYWQLEPAGIKGQYNYIDPVKTFRGLLVDSVKLRLRSDVPVGVCLSGGIDSSVITCIITKILGQKIQTFSSIYKNPKYGEKEFIDAVNHECDTQSHLIHPGPQDFFKVLTSLVKHHDKPVRMPGPYSQWHVFKCAKDNVIVTLDGQGADELLAGYPYFYPYYLADVLKKINFNKYNQVKKELKQRLGVDYSKDVLKILFPALLKLKHLFKKPSARWHDQILSHEFINQYSSRIKINTPRLFKSYLNQNLFETFVNTNLPMLLGNEDRISMAFSLESRVPFLDYRLVEFCFGLDNKYKMNGYATKYILRQAFKDILPQKIYHRKDKKGFPAPLEDWFRHELKDQLSDIFNSQEFGKHRILDRSKVQKLFSRHLSGQEKSRLLWRALNIHYWLKEYF